MVLSIVGMCGSVAVRYASSAIRMMSVRVRCCFFAWVSTHATRFAGCKVLIRVLSIFMYISYYN